MKIICLGNYPPRQCGIATFTENLVQAILHAARLHTVSVEMEVIAMNDCGKTYPYPPIVTQVIRHQEKDDYILMADYINHSGAGLCLIQHEYGIYGGESGLLLLALLRRVKIPVVATLHTVLQKPSFHQTEVLRKIAAYSSRVVVMNRLAIGFLTDVYTIPFQKIVNIQHGVPDFEVNKEVLIPRPLYWENRKVMLTFGLIGRSKGIETAIRALPAIVAKHPEILYVVLGKTHPHILHHAGEEYRNVLLMLVKQLDLEAHVVLVNEYVTELELMSYLKHADLYVTPYLNKAQITSGTLSYAISGGCAVLSTPYWHAEELLADGRGQLFGFGNYQELSTAINLLLDQPQSLLRLQQKAYAYGQTMAWPVIGKQYLDLFNSIIDHAKKHDAQTREAPQIRYPEFDVSHLKRFTDDTGLLQHARANVPYYKAGYCLDDNARAIIVCLTAWNKTHDTVYLDLLNKYLGYVTYMQQKDGSFTNYMTYEHFVLNDTSDDAFGRVFWALGCLIRFAPSNSLFHLGLELFDRAVPQLSKLNYARGYANCIFGLYHYIKRFPDQEKYLSLLQVLSDELCNKYKQHQRENWKWFEDAITYDNGLLPAALYKAYEISGNMRYLLVADESRGFLESKCFREGWLSLIGNRKWLRLDHEYEMFAQQPVDAMGMVLLYESAWAATGNREHIDKLHQSFDWFFGENDLNISLFDPETKGCYDGIEPFNINLNQGAESNIAYLLSWLTAEPLLEFKF